MNKIVGILGLRGGSGSTTVGVNLSAGLAIRGKKVLLIDNDQIGNLRKLIPENVKTTYDMESVYTGVPLKKAIYQSTIQGVDIVPFLVKDLNYHLNFSSLRYKRFNETDKNTLQKALNSRAIKDYDYVIIDNFRVLDLMTVNLLQVVDRVIVPVNDWIAKKKLEKPDEIISTASKIKLELRVDDIIMTKVMSNTVLFKKMREELIEVFGDKVCRTTMPQTIKLDEALHYKKSIYDHAPRSYAAVQSMKLVNELLDRLEKAT